MFYLIQLRIIKYFVVKRSNFAQNQPYPPPPLHVTIPHYIGLLIKNIFKNTLDRIFSKFILSETDIICSLQTHSTFQGISQLYVLVFTAQSEPQEQGSIFQQKYEIND